MEAKTSTMKRFPRIELVRKAKTSWICPAQMAEMMIIRKSWSSSSPHWIVFKALALRLGFCSQSKPDPLQGGGIGQQCGQSYDRHQPLDVKKAQKHPEIEQHEPLQPL